MKTRDLARMALFTALMVAGTYIKIPMPVCPITFQPFFAALAGVCLGKRNGALSAACFVFLGLIGLPVFTGGGGLWYVFKPTFGFLAGYIVQAYVTGEFVRRSRLELRGLIFACLAGLVIMYAIGLIYFWIISRYYLGSGLTVKGLIVNCLFIPFPKDTVMCVFAAVLGKKLLPVINSAQGRVYR